jgi:hypothetical protein
MRPISVSDTVNVENGKNIKAKTQIGDFEQIKGTEILRAALSLRQEFDSSYGSKETSSIQNYVFFDSAKKVSYWLKPKNEGLILSEIALSKNEDDQEANKFKPSQITPTAFIYLIADKDTNNDKRISWEDRKQIAISNSSGLEFKILIDQVDRFNGYSVVKNNRVFLFYQLENKIKVVEVDLRSQEIIGNSEFNTQPL